MANLVAANTFISQFPPTVQTINNEAALETLVRKTHVMQRLDRGHLHGV